jgi:sulfur-oxidizing protein SoxY
MRLSTQLVLSGGVVHRVLAGVMLAGAMLAATVLPATTQATEGPWQRLPAAAALLDGAQVRAGGLTLELPLVSEDGGAVPLSVAADVPVAEIHLFATRNPSPEIAVLRFHDAQIQPRVGTRVRLNETQQVIALARTPDGEWLATSREIRITVSGCLARSDEGTAADEMNTRVRAPGPLRAGQSGELLAMITHPMETGLREGTDGTVVPRRLIERVQIDYADTPAFEAELFAAVSANPFLRLQLAPEARGEVLIRWYEDAGRSAEARERVEMR